MGNLDKCNFSWGKTLGFHVHNSRWMWCISRVHIQSQPNIHHCHHTNIHKAYNYCKQGSHTQINKCMRIHNNQKKVSNTSCISEWVPSSQSTLRHFLYYTQMENQANSTLQQGFKPTNTIILSSQLAIIIFEGSTMDNESPSHTPSQVIYLDGNCSSQSPSSSSNSLI